MDNVEGKGKAPQIGTTEIKPTIRQWWSADSGNGRHHGGNIGGNVRYWGYVASSSFTRMNMQILWQHEGLNVICTTNSSDCFINIHFVNLNIGVEAFIENMVLIQFYTEVQMLYRKTEVYLMRRTCWQWNLFIVELFKYVPKYVILNAHNQL